MSNTIAPSISRRMVRNASSVWIDACWTRDEMHRIQISKRVADDMIVACNGACYALDLGDGEVLLTPA